MHIGETDANSNWETVNDTIKHCNDTYMDKGDTLSLCGECVRVRVHVRVCVCVNDDFIEGWVEH